MSNSKKRGWRSSHRLYFKSQTMDFNTQYMLGYADAQGAAVGEVLHIISQVNEKRLDTWTEAWTDMAVRVEEQAKTFSQMGRKISAREAYLRATTYFRASTFTIMEDGEKFDQQVERMHLCFREAMKCVDHPAEFVQIPYGDKFLPGCFLRPSPDNKPRPTLIMIGGGELFYEELYFWVGPGGLKRSWNVLIVDLPGQGSTLQQGLLFEANTAPSMGAIIDFLTEKDSVDASKITALGVSLGGYLVMRAAAEEHRLAAIAVSTPMPDAEKWLLDGVPLPIAQMPNWMVQGIFNIVTSLDRQMKTAFSKWFARLGVSSFVDALDLLSSWKVDMDAITCPVLCLLGEGEAKTLHNQTHLAVDRLGGRATFHMAKIIEGADGHCQSNNYPYLNAVVFNWFEEKLAVCKGHGSS